MNTENKELLLKDLCARLPYGVIVQIPELFYTTKTIDVKLDAIFKVNDDFHFTDDYGYLLENIKPYLRPMYSMTEEEKKEFNSLMYGVEERCINAYGKGGYTLAFTEVNDWLNAHHFDYRGLIKKGLAIKVTPENNPYK